jgi:putative toxin-antitoxin system antitoxin component (TIGR02293 family)
MATKQHPIERYFNGSTDGGVDLAQAAERGLPLNSIAYLKERGISFSELADIVISPRTLKHRKARREPLSIAETDRALRLARILSLADQVFGDHEKALMWLRQTDDRINDRSPLSMLQTESGGRLIERLLWQVDEGVYS